MRFPQYVNTSPVFIVIVMCNFCLISPIAFTVSKSFMLHATRISSTCECMTAVTMPCLFRWMYHAVSKAHSLKRCVA